MAPSFLLAPNYSSMAHCDAVGVEPSTPSDKSAHASKALETDFLDMKVAEKSLLQIASNKIELPL